MRFKDKSTSMQSGIGDATKSFSIMYELTSSKSTGADANSGGAISVIR